MRCIRAAAKSRVADPLSIHVKALMQETGRAGNVMSWQLAVV